jgi:hypothetical protein
VAVHNILSVGTTGSSRRFGYAAMLSMDPENRSDRLTMSRHAMMASGPPRTVPYCTKKRYRGKPERLFRYFT